MILFPCSSISDEVKGTRPHQKPRERRRTPPKPDFGEMDVQPEPRQQPPLSLLQTIFLENKQKEKREVQKMKQDVYQLASGPRLGIFSRNEIKDWPVQPKPGILDTWHKLKKQELKALYTHPPRNAFEEWILWTEQGKLWKFPIDNEQGKLKLVIIS